MYTLPTVSVVEDEFNKDVTDQYAIPTTIARSRSTKARTNSIIAFDIGQRTIISQIPSITVIATTPTTPNARRTPPGPEIARISPVFVPKPMPIVPLIVMAYMI
jgi:hypothetical protein